MREHHIRVVAEKPPNWKQLLAAFPYAEHWPGLIVTYGPMCYMPNGADVLEPPLRAHECCHSERQGDDPEGWWGRCYSDKEFCFGEELIAHQAEWLVYKESAPSRHLRRMAIEHLSKRLSGPLYGRLITFAKARRAIERALPATHETRYPPWYAVDHTAFEMTSEAIREGLRAA